MHIIHLYNKALLTPQKELNLLFAAKWVEVESVKWNKWDREESTVCFLYYVDVKKINLNVGHWLLDVEKWGQAGAKENPYLLSALCIYCSVTQKLMNMYNESRLVQDSFWIKR